MNVSAEKKSTLTLEKKDTAGDAHDGSHKSIGGQVNTIQMDSQVSFREAVLAIDAERNELAKAAINGIKPGKPFDQNLVREINRLETKKNRLVVARFAALLRKNAGDVQAIVHQIIEI